MRHEMLEKNEQVATKGPPVFQDFCRTAGKVVC
jgi:hypothetical protein